MKKTFRVLLTLALTLLFTTSMFAQGDEKSQRIKSAYLIALGRLPAQGELDHWRGRENYSMKQLVQFYTDYMNSNTSEKRRVVIKAFTDSYGWAPDQNLINQGMANSMNYTERINNNVNYMRSGDGTKNFNEMIAKVYWNVCGRWATTNDRNSWPQSEAKSYMAVAAIVENWHRTSTSQKNTMGSSSKYLIMERVSGPVANEAARIIGSAGGNVVAPGGGNVVAPGGGNVIAAGGGN